jgi:transcriptional regulator GlxA family with amidase domain
MKHVSILIPQGHTSLVNIEGTHQILGEVNNLRTGMGKAPLFDIQLVGLSKETSQRDGLFIIKPDCLLKDVPKTDLVIIPAIHGHFPTIVAENQAFIQWTIQQYNNGAEVASLCIGSFFLAATGLLKGKQCATHWRFTNEFRALYPDVQLVDEQIITDEDGLYTSGGAYAYLNLLVYMIEKYAGRDIAILIAKAFMIDIDRTLQSPFIIFQGQKSHEDETVRKAQEYIEKNFEEKITVDHLAGTFAVGRRSLERRFKKATCNTVTEYIQRVKIEAAKKDLETGRKNVHEVMYDVGYSDVKAFRSIFKKITGLSPIEYRNKYNKEMLVMD